MTKALFAFCLIACIVVAIISDWKIRNRDGIPDFRSTAIHTLPLNKNLPLVGVGTEDMTDNLSIQPPIAAQYSLSSPWKLALPQEAVGKENRTVATPFFCRSFVISDGGKMAAIIVADISNILNAHIDAAKNSLEILGFDKQAITITTSGVIVPIEISPSTFASIAVSSVKKAVANLQPASYSYSVIEDSSIVNKSARVQTEDAGAVDLHVRSISGNGIAKWLSFFSKDTSYKLLQSNTGQNENARMDIISFKNRSDEPLCCFIISNVRPIVMAGSQSITTDISGIVSQFIEKKTGFTTYYVATPEIDFVPYLERTEMTDISSTRRIGTRLASLVQRELKRARYTPLKEAFVYSMHIDIPLKKEFTLPASRRTELALRYENQLKDVKPLNFDRADKRVLLERAIRYSMPDIFKRKENDSLRSILTLTGIRIDTLSLFFMPAGLFRSTMDSVKQHAKQSIVFASGVNYLGNNILPDNYFYDGGWYSATSAYGYRSEQIIMESAITMIETTLPLTIRKRTEKKWRYHN